MIESAEIMTATDLKSYYDSIATRYAKNKSASKEAIEAAKEQIFAAYEQYETKQRQQYVQDWKDYIQLEKGWKSKTCLVCSAPMKIVNGQYNDFWGCTNYGDGRDHTTFHVNQEAHLQNKKQYIKVKIDVNWLTDLIRGVPLPGVVKASDLLAFLNLHGYEDLRSKNGYKKSVESISGFTRAKSHSAKEEKEIVQQLTTKFEKVLSQVGVRYTLSGQAEKVAIIDVIASDEQQVFVLEIKRNIMDINEEQLMLYERLVEYLLRQQKDGRACSAVFVVYNRNAWDAYTSNKIPYVYFDIIGKQPDAAAIQSLLAKHALGTTKT